MVDYPNLKKVLGIVQFFCFKTQATGLVTKLPIQF